MTQNDRPRQLEQFLTEKDVARILKVSVRTVQGWRLRGDGPRWTTFGGNVRYRPTDIAVYVDRLSGENVKKRSSE